MDVFIGTVMLFAGNFAPNGWAFCDGSLLQIRQYTALFSLLGTSFGGDGVNTFGLPDLRGRVVVGSGNGPGLAPYVPGNKGGVENVTLVTSQIPVHSHLVNVNNSDGSQSDPTNNVPGNVAPNTAYSSVRQNATMAPTMIAPAGGSQPHENRQPYLSINYIIALVGIFPSRG
jgi:microcystin-dependent protein